MGGVISGNTKRMDVAADVMNSDGSSSVYYSSRKAHHAGSWYSDDTKQLQHVLEGYLQQVNLEQHIQSQINTHHALRAIICPHAGYSYSGPTAAYSYMALLQELSLRPPYQNNINSSSNAITQIVVLHPSHHVLLRSSCAISGAHRIDTPLGSIQVDDTLRNEILQLSLTSDRNKYQFAVMTQAQDEQEHSGEMQYPYIAHVFKKLREMVSVENSNDIHRITVTPIMCGSLTEDDEIAYGNLLSEILHRPNVLTIISTDFCHWGSRFAYRPTTIKDINKDTATASSSKNAIINTTTTTQVPIHDVIQQLDRRGMDLIEAQQPGAFASYLRETNNTICGRHAVAVWLRAISAPKATMTATATTTTKDDAITKLVAQQQSNQLLQQQQCTIQFIQYAQSSKAASMSDSSVSYAAAIAILPISQ